VLGIDPVLGKHSKTEHEIKEKCQGKGSSEQLDERDIKESTSRKLSGDMESRERNEQLCQYTQRSCKEG
jgi:hypothetical protein